MRRKERILLPSITLEGYTPATGSDGFLALSKRLIPTKAAATIKIAGMPMPNCGTPVVAVVDTDVVDIVDTVTLVAESASSRPNQALVPLVRGVVKSAEPVFESVILKVTPVVS